MLFRTLRKHYIQSQESQSERSLGYPAVPLSKLFWSLFLAIGKDEHPAIALQNSCDIQLTQQTQWQCGPPIQYTSKLKKGQPSETK